VEGKTLAIIGVGHIGGGAAEQARKVGMRVLGICSLTNAFGEHVTHEEVVRVSNETALTVGRLLVDLLPRLPGPKAGT